MSISTTQHYINTVYRWSDVPHGCPFEHIGSRALVLGVQCVFKNTAENSRYEGSIDPSKHHREMPTKSTGSLGISRPTPLYSTRVQKTHKNSDKNVTVGNKNDGCGLSG